MEDFEDKREELILSLQTALYALRKIYPHFNDFPEHNRETPRRIADSWIEMFKGLEEPTFNFTTFPNEHPCEEVVLDGIEFSSMCMHHFMPFSGTVKITYSPGKTICGISKLARVVDYFSARPQIQEKMGEEIKAFLVKHLDPTYLHIVIESKHSCVGCRGAKSRNSSMTTQHIYYKGRE